MISSHRAIFVLCVTTFGALLLIFFWGLDVSDPAMPSEPTTLPTVGPIMPLPPPLTPEDEPATPATAASLTIQAPGEVGIATTAHRGPSIQVTEPPVASPPAGSDNCEQMFWWRAYFGLPARFNQIGQRESGVGQCLNTAISRTGCCVGWWQLHWVNFNDHRMIEPFAACGATWKNVRGDDMQSKRRQACATKALYEEVGYTPWAT